MYGRGVSAPTVMIAVVAALHMSVFGTDRQAVARANDCLAVPNASSPQGQHWYYRIDQPNHRKCWYLHATLGLPHHAAKRSDVPAVSATAGALMSESPANSAPRLARIEILAVKPQPAPLVGKIAEEPVQQNDTSSIPLAMQGGAPQVDGSEPVEIIAAPDTRPAAATLRLAAIDADGARPLADAKAFDGGERIADRSTPTIMAVASALTTPLQIFFVLVFGIASAVFLISAVTIHHRDTSLVTYQLHHQQPDTAALHEVAWTRRDGQSRPCRTQLSAARPKDGAAISTSRG